MQSRTHSCTLRLTTNSPRSFSGPTCDCNASLVQCQDMVQRSVKIPDPLKRKAHVKASLLTSTWLGIETVREMEVPAVEKLTPAKWTQHCYLKQCRRRDYAAASVSVLTQLLRLQKEKAPKCYFLTEDSLMQVMAVQQGKIRPWHCLSKVREVVQGCWRNRSIKIRPQVCGLLNAGVFFPHVQLYISLQKWRSSCEYAGHFKLLQAAGIPHFLFI